MRTMWIGGKSSNLRPGGVTRLGPANPTGLARADQCVSVGTLTPSSWTRSVEWPTHVNVSAPGLDRMALKSLATTGRLAARGWNFAGQTRETMQRYLTH